MNFLIAYNNQQDFDSTRIHNAITNSGLVSDWWHYLPNIYLVSTDKGSQEIASIITNQFPGLLFFVTQVNLNDVNGLLPKTAWDWINRKIRFLLKLKSVQSPALPPIGQDPISPLRKLFETQNQPVKGTASKSLLEDLLKAGR